MMGQEDELVSNTDLRMMVCIGELCVLCMLHIFHIS